MDLRYSLPMKVISTIVITIFLWTFGGIFDIAYAVKKSDGLRAAGYEGKTRKKRPEEKFGRVIKDIEQVLTDTVTDTDTKKGKLKAKKAEIEALDKEIRKKFAETGKKLKEAKLPEEILKRHYEFVRKYEEKLKELKVRLEEIERGRTKREIEEAHRKAKEFFEKIKPPKKYIPLDPNNLPHRTAEPVRKKPRLKKEEFEPQSTQRARRGDSKQEPVLVASNGPLTGLLTPSLSYETQSLEPETRSSAPEPRPLSTYPLTDPTISPASPAPVLLALLSNPPTDADLAETIEIQFTPAIVAKAEELNRNPVNIYNWVRNNIEFVPTYGSIQGADMCLQTKQCNAFDTASLLIALLRASGIHARYVYGTVQMPIEKVMNWVGGFTDANAALDFIASGGIPVIGLASGGKIVKARMEHMWVEAYVPYGPYSGRPSKLNPPKTWIPLDPSFKQYNYTQGIDIQTAVPFDAETFINQIQQTATINETESYVTAIDSSLINQTMQDYQAQVENYITQNYPGATVGDVLGKKEIIKQELGILPVSLPYKRIVTGERYSEIPDNLRYKIKFKLIKNVYDDFSDTFMEITKSLPEIAGKKITLSYSPATEADEAVINSYLPEPNEDDTPIDPSELPTSLPAYLINVRPELRIDGELVATGSIVRLGSDETFTMTFTAPNKTAGVVPNEITAGAYYAIAIDTGRISEAQMQELKAKLEATKAKLETQDFAGLTKDDIIGDLLYATALSYFAEMDAMDHVTAKTMGIENVRLPSEAAFSYELDTIFIFDSPMYVSSGGLAMDIDRDVTASVPLDGDMDKLVQFVLASGMNGSALEHAVPGQMFSTPESPAEGISAVKALQIANDQGIPIYTVNQTNIGTVLPQLEVSSRIKTNIVNAVNAGMVVTVPKTNITYNGWTGVGYIIINPDTGAGAYMIGGLSGGWLFWVGFAFLIIAILAIGALCLLSGVCAAIAAALSTVFGTVTSSISELILTIAVIWQVYLAETLFWLTVSSAVLCWQATPPSPPDYYTYVCAWAIVLATLLRGVKGR